MSTQAGKSRTSRSLATTLTIAFVALSVTALLVASGFEMYFSLQTQREVVASRQQLIAQDAANAVTSFVQEKFSILEAAVELGDLASASQEEQRDALWSLLDLDPSFRRLVLLDSQMQERAEASRLPRTLLGNLVERAESDLFDQVRKGNRYVCSVYVDPVTSEPMVIMAVPVTDVSGDFQGALLAEANLRFMWSLISGLEIGEEGLAYVVDRQGDLIASRDIWRVLGHENLSHLKEVGEFVSSSAPFDENGANISTGIDGTTVVGTYIPLGAPDWAVVTEMPVAEAYGPVIRSIAMSVSIMLAGVVLAGLLGVYIARRLAAPLLNLTATASRIAGGEIGMQAAIEGPAEVAGLARAFNHMTAQLRDLIGSLEQRVADRTRNLQTAAEVASVATALLDPGELLRQTVDLVRERFDLYYVGLFLLDAEGRFAVLRAGTGEAGQRLLAQGHRLEVGGSSMIGQCVATGQARIALDVGVEAVRFDNPLLPETRSEMALPLRSRGQVIGAMTVQSVQEAAFDEADIAVMQTMADQVAVALDNARLFNEAQAALRELQAVHRRYLGRAWTEYARRRAVSGYQHTDAGTLSMGDQVLPEVQQAMVKQRPIERSTPAALAVPIVLRGQPIGALGFKGGDGGRPQREEDVALLSTIAEQFALAADNLRLLDETQRRAERERLIGEVTARMRETLDMDTILRTAVRQMRDKLDLLEAEVRLGTGMVSEMGDSADRNDL